MIRPHILRGRKRGERVRGKEGREKEKQVFRFPDTLSSGSSQEAIPQDAGRWH